MQTALVRAALRAGAGRACAGYHIGLTPAADSIERVLHDVLGQPVTIGIFLGPPRANLKPVLQVLDRRDGRLLAIAKVGLTALTRQLAETEAQALTHLAVRRSPALATPELLHFGYWRGHTVLVQSALELERTPLSIDRTVRDLAMREVALHNGVTTGPLQGSSYLAGLERRLTSLSGTGPSDGLRQALRAAAEGVARFGSWHGDWTPWNMAVRHGRALVWDWERYGRDVPLGFDALHYAFMLALRSKGGSTDAGLALLRSCSEILRPFGVRGPEAKRIALFYMLDLAIRYLADRQAETGVSGDDVTQWLKPVLSVVRIEGISEVGGSDG